VQVTQGTGYLSSIEASPWFQEATLPLEMVEQLSTVDVVKDKVQFVSSLEREVKAHQERVFHILQ